MSNSESTTGNNDISSAEPQGESSRSTGSSGTWMFWLIGILLAVMTVWSVWMVFKSSPTMPADRPADPLAMETLGFNLDNCTVDRSLIRGGGPTKDGIPSLTDPEFVAGADVEEVNRKMHGKFLVSSERVIGVTVGDESRAYPLSILTWHEVVNDTLGGVPVVVSYCPLCDSAVVFERTVGDEVLEFGVSGLLYNSNVLLYDRRSRRSGVEESLWSQLKMEAVCGPAADRGDTLTVLPSQLAHWGEWLADNPKTTVISFPTKYDRKYNENPYKNEFLNGELMFEVSPKPEGDLPPLTRIVAVRLNGEWRAYYYDVPGKEPSPDAAEWVIDGLRFTYTPPSAAADPPVVAVTMEDGNPVETAYAFWEAWYAMHPDTAEPVRLKIPD